MSNNFQTSSASWAFGLAGGYPDSDDENDANQDQDAMEDIVPTDQGLTNGVLHQGEDNAGSDVGSLFDDENTPDELDRGQGSSVPRPEHDGGDTGNLKDEFVPPPGFYDDVEKDYNQESTSDNPFAGIETTPKARAKKQSPNQKKSPRRSDEVDPDDSPKLKKSRKSLLNQSEDEADDESDPAQGQGAIASLFGSHSHQPANPNAELQAAASLFAQGSGEFSNPTNLQDQHENRSAGIGHRMSNLSLNEEFGEGSAGPSRPSNGFGLVASDTDSSDDESPSPSHRRKKGPIPYHLRTNVERNITGTYVDQDYSGDYDPDEEFKKKQIADAKAKERRRKGKQPKPQKEVVPKLIVRLKFRAIGTVLNLTDGQDNWPEGWSDVDSEEERERLERREARRISAAHVKQDPIEDPAGLLDDLTGHPVARGCKNCRRNRLNCTMVKGGTWPCDQCVEQDFDCEPIIKPKVKGKCNHCTENIDDDEENYCSFEWSALEPHDVCRQCLEKGYDDCIAEIPEDYTTPRIDLDQLAYGPDRKWVSCTHCRAEKKKCSVKSKDDKGPCKLCKRSKIPCTFYDVQRAVSSKIEGKKKVVVEVEPAEAGPSHSRPGQGDRESSPLLTAADFDVDDEEELPQLPRSPSPEIVMEDVHGRKGVFTKITTSFSHPIQFNVQVESECNFCGMPLFGFMGYFEREVHVLRWNNGLGYTELLGGHREESGETVICEACTLARLQMIACEDHDIQPLAREEDLPDMETAAGLLIAAEPHSYDMHQQLQRWCSMCFSLATFQCCTVQPSLGAEDGDEISTLEGCGLRFCNACEVRFREEFHSNSQEMAAAFDQVPKAKGAKDEEMIGQVRADVGFLSGKGLLMKNMEALC
jgi:hypothetical protein